MAKFNLDTYVTVNQRIAAFYQAHPEGRIVTEIVEHDRESGFVMVKACVFRDGIALEPSGTGHAFEQRNQGHINPTSYVENCETSATGRALAMLGFGIAGAIASREELEKVQRMTADDMKVVRQNGHYIVDNRFKVTKPNGKIECDCGIVACPHIEAVRAFATSSNN